MRPRVQTLFWISTYASSQPPRFQAASSELPSNVLGMFSILYTLLPIDIHEAIACIMSFVSLNEHVFITPPQSPIAGCDP